MNRLTACVAAGGFRHQIEVLGRADAAGDSVEQLVSGVWDRLLHLLGSYAGAHDLPRVHDALRDLFRPLAGQLINTIATSVTNGANESYSSAAANVTRQLPSHTVKATVAPVFESRSTRLTESLRVPDFRQKLSYDCGAACVRSVAAYFGVNGKRSESDFIRLVGAEPETGAHPDAIRAGCEALGLTAVITEPMAVGDLDRCTRMGRPVICPIQIGEPISGMRTGHYVVVLGVDDHHVFYQDPLAGRCAMPIDEFKARWHDVEANGEIDVHLGIIVGGQRTRLQERDIPNTARGLIGIEPSGTFDLSAGIELLGDEAARDLFQSLIFPPPDESVVRAVVFQSNWVQRLATQTALGTPDAIASKVVQALATGKKVNELARDLLPVVNGVRSTARRIARDENMHAAHAMQHQAWAQLGDMVTGYQVNAVLDERTRPLHRARNGQVFYKQPKGSQLGMNECPQPPREADGSHAYNCRCFLTPVLMVADDEGNNITPPAPIDRDATAEWFDDTSERNQRIAVGVERFELAKDMLGRKPSWLDFTDQAGNMLPVDSLRYNLSRT